MKVGQMASIAKDVLQKSWLTRSIASIKRRPCLFGHRRQITQELGHPPSSSSAVRKEPLQPLRLARSTARPPIWPRGGGEGSVSRRRRDGLRHQAPQPHFGKRLG